MKDFYDFCDRDGFGILVFAWIFAWMVVKLAMIWRGYTE